MGWATAITALIGLVAGIWAVFFDPKRKKRKQAYEDGKKAIKDRDPSRITSNFDRMQ